MTLFYYFIHVWAKELGQELDQELGPQSVHLLKVSFHFYKIGFQPNRFFISLQHQLGSISYYFQGIYTLASRVTNDLPVYYTVITEPATCFTLLLLMIVNLGPYFIIFRVFYVGTSGRR